MANKTKDETDIQEEQADVQEEQHEKEKSKQSTLDEIGNQVEKFAVKTAESIKKVIDKALASRNTVMTIRVNDECNTKMNMLVDAGFFKSRSESAAFLIQEGIKRREDLFVKIEGKLKKMGKIRDEIKTIVASELDDSE
jgi:Arc/MetJ-type ribon-helix-helix transcriptional regulator